MQPFIKRYVIFTALNSLVDRHSSRSANRALLSCSRYHRMCFFIKSGSTKENAFMIIAVLSAPNNFEARNSIRDTWKSLTNRPYLKFYFLIGRQNCQIHPFDRKSEFSCDEFHFTQNNDSACKKSGWTPVMLNHYDLLSTTSGASSFTFRVNYPVIIRGIRLWKQSIKGLSKAVVNLKNARTGHLVTSVSFEIPNSPYNDSIWLESQTNPFLLPKSFDAEVEIDLKYLESYNGVSIPCYGFSNWFDLCGAIQLTSQFHPDSGWINFNNKSCTPISLLLELNDIEAHVKEADARSLQWQSHIKTLAQNLDHEVAMYKDIIFTDVVDVYRNIPQKLLHFYKWASQNINFTYLLKTDDDTFIDIPAVTKFLQAVPTKDALQMWWWGKLRHGLPVERHGKWQELEYGAPVYPPFLCGGGYVINNIVVEYLVRNYQWLYNFQGEDTCLGIWLSGVHPVSPKTASCKWSCTSECDQTSCNRCQLSTEEMLSVWKKYEENRTIC
ncbi:UDP-GalNAc:beta-1,3-N-acetylgalactosaminyltransferase 2 [Frankliniella fusca]|uniref:Hexosyltransferase n=1 Tax=Frankliniella fusca TaxID=407009 RepID=A0AAE1GUM2_9NEOP|nr:UDP-GalNAc:beta-1,3-N-acetylgalactosaminyltransferase 2 [Frankliniella fusca]